MSYQYYSENKHFCTATVLLVCILQKILLWQNIFFFPGYVKMEHSRIFR